MTVRAGRVRQQQLLRLVGGQFSGGRLLVVRFVRPGSRTQLDVGSAHCVAGHLKGWPGQADRHLNRGSELVR